MAKPLKAFIVAFVGSDNLGDEVIFKSLVTRLKTMNLAISALSKNAEKTLSHGVTPVSSSRPDQIINAIRRADVVILGGGGLLQDATSLYNIPFFTLPVLLAQWLGKKTFIVSIGAGPVNSRISKWLVSRVVRHADLITARDESSRQLLLKLGARPERTHLVSDPALDFTPDHPTPKIMPDTFKYKNGYVVVSLRHWYDTRSLVPVALNQRLKHLRGNSSSEYDAFVKRMAEFLDYIVQELELGLVFVSFFGVRDIAAARDVAAHMHSSNLHFFDRPIGAGEYVTLVQDASFVVAMRLHAAIIAAGNGSPVLAISYLDKVKNFMASLGLHDFTLSLDDVNTPASRECTRRLYDERDDIITTINSATAELRTLNDNNITLIRNHLQNANNSDEIIP